MFNSIKESPIYPIVNPQSIAFFGASNNFASMGSNLLSSVRSLGFEGAIYPVHPKEKQVQGYKAYQNVLDLPETPDLAIIVLHTDIVCRAVEECGQKGIKHAIIISAGFKEVGGRGANQEKELLDVAEKYGLRILGPNCLGVINPHHKLNTTWMPYEAPAGFIGMASQSGSFINQTLGRISKLGLGFSTAFSVGNELNTDIVDCMEYLGACPHTKVIALYIEGINRGRAFLEAARAIVPHKPIVALYVGGSEAGRRAGLSHTGAMAGPDNLYDGIFRQSGVIRARSITELFDFCWALGTLPECKGRRVMIQTHSGGPGATAADACGRAGLEVPALSPQTLEKLSELLPHTASANNPVDVTFSRNPLFYYSEIPKALLENKDADILLMYCYTPTESVIRSLESLGASREEAAKQAVIRIDAQSQAIAGLLERRDKPIIGFTYSSSDDRFIQGLVERGVPVFSGPEQAARVMEALVGYSSRRHGIMAGASEN
ncbi:MAG: CoA-binding protein [Thermodesulfobacteriota bacterium]|nr:CoA-binding protein [Thermodesulfobacteriota bacterium]